MENRPPALASELVQKFVQDAHGNLASVTEMLKQEPQLVNCSWDWGGGDWETGLGAAAHMGNRPIAELLIAHGARIDLFAAAMLGELEIVRSILNRYPEMRSALGPHTIPLIVHAQHGGNEARPVLEYLESLS